jgi:hypothetical protein
VIAITVLNCGIDTIPGSGRAFDDIPGVQPIDPADTVALATLTALAD